MIDRYTRPAFRELWSDESKFRCWLEVETVASEVLADAGIVPREAATAIRERGGFDVERIRAIEKETRHDVIAFTTSVAEKVGPESRWFHFGLTSTDVVDTAQALQLKQASSVILEGMRALSTVLRRRAVEFATTPCIGRTHGVHAEPTTFGLKLLLWYTECERNIVRFSAAAEEMRVGKLSGAVGSYGTVTPALEEEICRRLGLNTAQVSTQVLQRDRHAAYVGSLALLASSLDRIATEIRHLQRTEVREAEEFFSAKQKGSSAMPHKRNPITCENICGLARVMRANSQVALEDVALWHERDISHSSAERVILPDQTTLADYLLSKTVNLIDKLMVYPERMLRNLNLTGGLVFSGQLLLDLAEAGMSREDAYLTVQTLAMHAWSNDLVFRELVSADPKITSLLSPEKIARAFDVERRLENVPAIFERVLGSNLTDLQKTLG
ncbi:MAG: adenylosuccinate lyase [Janthinobacterium lividum]